MTHMEVEGFDVRGHFGPRAGSYDEAFTAAPGLEAISDWELGTVRRRLGEVEGRRVLDAGTGTGRVARLLVDAGAAVVGIDLTRSMLDRCRVRTPEAAAVISRLGVPLPFRTASFDDAVCIRVMKYVPDWDTAFRELRRVLRPGARLVVEFANRRSVARWGYPGSAIVLTTVEEARARLGAAGFLPFAVDGGTRLPYTVHRRAHPRVAQAAGAAERAAQLALGDTTLARSFLITAEVV